MVQPATARGPDLITVLLSERTEPSERWFDTLARGGKAQRNEWMEQIRESTGTKKGRAEFET
jgi:hypothetical protein